LIVKLVVGWFFVLFVIMIGPLAIQNSEKGPYFGVSGLWCWITSQYPLEHILLEYLLEFLSAGVSLLLYLAIFLCVRGNLTRDTTHRWRLHFVPRSERWQLTMAQDAIDRASLPVACVSLWAASAYALLLMPIAATRFAEFASGGDACTPPLWLWVFAASVFTLNGVVDAAILLAMCRAMPDMRVLPALSTRRAKVDHEAAVVGVMPFDLAQPIEKLERTASGRSEDSRAPLVPTKLEPEREHVDV